MALELNPQAPATQPVVLNSEIRCALTGRTLKPEEAYWAPPLVTTQELVATVSRNLLTPGALGALLFGEQPNVPYAPETRQQLAARRSTEQLKLLLLLLLVAALLITPIVLLVSGGDRR
ncbi:hypothetical protein HC891_04450 [Candidatus Gracilibacteria bacterium]|nr:hypothetical protein [Candidatus Gracilibacteria bacterium]